jgi:hypothetical protein
MEDKLFDLLSDNPTLITYCPVCNLRYQPLEGRVIDEVNNAHLVYIQCRHCKSSVLALVVVNDLGLSSVGIVTDLIGDDIIKFKSEKSIEADDVIEIHQLLGKEKALIDYLD